MRRRTFLASLGGVVLAAPALAAAQARTQFRARLSTVPLDVAMQSTIAGSGAATATLTGSRLTVTGTFTGLKSPVTLARVHVGPKGMRGPAVFDLKVTGDVTGTISGAFDLAPAQVEDVTKSRDYIQIHSEKAPDGNLWGWLLPQEKTR
jgi:hypothetical protein